MTAVTTDLIAESSDAAGDHTVYRGSRLRHVAMPLGGVGAGHIALGGDGGLRQWQIHNQVNHRGFVPDSFFAIRAASIEPPLNVIRLLQSREVMDLPADHTPLVTDDDIPEDQRRLVERSRESSGPSSPPPTLRPNSLPRRCPAARNQPRGLHALHTPRRAPAACRSSSPLHAPQSQRAKRPWRAGRNTPERVGWDGLTPISGNRNPLFGGNTNRHRRGPGRSSLIMENPSLPLDHPGAGQMVLTALADNVRACEQWTDPEQMLRFMEGLKSPASSSVPTARCNAHIGPCRSCRMAQARPAQPGTAA